MARDSPLAWVRRLPAYGTAARLPMLAYRLGLGPIVGRLFLVVSMRGRRSGRTRRVMLTYLRSAGRDHAAAIYGHRSQWLRNLSADPRCRVQTARGSYTATARRIGSPDGILAFRSRLGLPGRLLLAGYLRLIGIPDHPDAIRMQASRVLLVAFEPETVEAPEPMPADLRWIWLPLLGLALARRLRSVHQ